MSGSDEIFTSLVRFSRWRKNIFTFGEMVLSLDKFVQKLFEIWLHVLYQDASCILGLPLRGLTRCLRCLLYNLSSDEIFGIMPIFFGNCWRFFYFWRLDRYFLIPSESKVIFLIQCSISYIQPVFTSAGSKSIKIFPARFFKIWSTFSGLAKMESSLILPAPSRISIILFPVLRV